MMPNVSVDFRIEFLSAALARHWFSWSDGLLATE